MPITIEFVDTGIYVARWHGRISNDEVIGKMAKIKALANDYGEQRFCLILDLTKVEVVPSPTANLGQITESEAQNVHLIAVKTPHLGDRFTRIVDQFTQQTYIQVDSYDDAIERARALLKQELQLL